MFKLHELLERIHGDRVLMALEGIVQRERTKLYLVGGTIRDLALGSDRRDYDFILQRREMGFVPRLALELKGHFFSIGRDEKQRVCRILLGDDILDFTAMDGSTIGEDLGKGISPSMQWLIHSTSIDSTFTRGPGRISMKNSSEWFLPRGSIEIPSG